MLKTKTVVQAAQVTYVEQPKLDFSDEEDSFTDLIAIGTVLPFYGGILPDGWMEVTSWPAHDWENSSIKYAMKVR